MIPEEQQSGTPSAEQTWQLEGSGSQAYDAYLVPKLFRPWAERLLDLVEPSEGDHVLDVACGTGIVARTAVPHVGPDGGVTAVDLNEGMLATARSAASGIQPDIDWRQGDAAALPFPDETFDITVCQQALQFVPDPSTVLAEMRRVLRSSGRLGLAVLRPLSYQPAYTLLADALETHAGAEAGAMMRSPFPDWDTETLRRLVVDAGFSNPEIRLDIGPVRFPSAREFLRQEVASSPLAEPIADLETGIRDRMLDAVEDTLRPYTDDAGIVFPVETYLVVAH